MVARQAAQQIIDLRYTLCMMGIPLDGPSWIFSDNESVITSYTIPHILVTKVTMPFLTIVSVNALQQKFCFLLHVSGKLNITYMLTKPLGWVSFWPLVHPLFFWKGEIQDKPFSLVIQGIKADPPIGSRGVTDKTS
jgi:hypothetical protein